jgi:tetrathionate reductase subunit B
LPACVETCVGGALIFGDVSDPDSTISQIIAKNSVTVLRREMGTFPNVYYIGADYTDESHAGRLDGRRAPVRVTTHRPYEKRR